MIIEDWTKPDKDGNINVPDELDKLVNKIGMQIAFMTLSGKNQVQTICDIVFISERFFNDRMIEKLNQYNEFLLKNGYCDTDIISEKPTALDKFLILDK